MIFAEVKGLIKSKPISILDSSKYYFTTIMGNSNVIS